MTSLIDHSQGLTLISSELEDVLDQSFIEKNNEILTLSFNSTADEILNFKFDGKFTLTNDVFKLKFANFPHDNIFNLKIGSRYQIVIQFAGGKSLFLFDGKFAKLSKLSIKSDLSALLTFTTA